MKKRVIALGFFDGVHIGHGSLIRRTRERAEALGVSPAILTFDVHPDTLVFGRSVPLISSPEDRAELVSRLYGVEEIIALRFDTRLMQMPWDDFLVWVQSEFGAVHLVCGHDFSFGDRGQGTPARLQEKCRELGMGSDVMPEISMDGSAISSTRIRSLLLEGRLAEANRLLGHPYVLTDLVRSGFRLGRQLGAPTVNMRFADGVLVPAYGVYAARLSIEGDTEIRYAMTNVGVRPTVSSGEAVSVESYILDYSGDLYGKKIRLEFLSYLRPERRFADVTALRTQLRLDEQSVRERLRSV